MFATGRHAAVTHSLTSNHCRTIKNNISAPSLGTKEKNYTHTLVTVLLFSLEG